MLIGSPYLTPRVALVDPTLMVSVPPAITAATGVDALTHAIEAYVSRRANPISERAGPFRHAPHRRQPARAHVQADESGARTAMAMGSLQAGMALPMPPSPSCNGMARPLGAYFGITHGVSNAALLATVVGFLWIRRSSAIVTSPRAYGREVGAADPC